MPNKGSVLDHFLVSEEGEGITWVPWAASIKDPADVDDYQPVTFRNVSSFRVPTVDSVTSEYFARMVSVQQRGLPFAAMFFTDVCFWRVFRWCAGARG